MKFPKLVIEEAKALKKFATTSEIEKLSYDFLDTESHHRCIYGQMTGSCYSKRASELIGKCCTRVYSKEAAPIIGQGVKLNGKPLFADGNRIAPKGYDAWLSPIEVFISRARHVENDEKSLHKLVQFIKGEIKSL